MVIIILICLILKKIMPQKIDRIGRSHEWGTRYFLLKTEQSKKDFENFKCYLDENDWKRVLIASEKSSEKIKSYFPNNQIIDAKVTGEENKKSGNEDYDLVITLDNNEKKGYSLKIQCNFEGVNVRNATLNSICKGLIGKKFEELVTSMEYQEYIKKGNEYSEGKLKSDVLGVWGAEILAKYCQKSLGDNPSFFIKNIKREVRYETNLILTVVDKKLNFKGFCTTFSKRFEDITQNPSKLKIKQKGISVHLYYENIDLAHIDVYMMSSSLGKGKKLRIAIRVNFCLDDQ